MDTGVGRSAYSIMEQGRIDLILSSRPEDRRAVFEEAAGITKYKSQRRDATRKLEQTDGNLARLTDVLAEVKRQLGSLQRQAAKARRHRALSADLRLLDTHLAHEQSTRLERDLAAPKPNSPAPAPPRRTPSANCTPARRQLAEARAVSKTSHARSRKPARPRGNAATGCVPPKAAGSSTASAPPRARRCANATRPSCRRGGTSARAGGGTPRRRGGNAEIAALLRRPGTPREQDALVREARDHARRGGRRPSRTPSAPPRTPSAASDSAAPNSPPWPSSSRRATCAGKCWRRNSPASNPPAPPGNAPPPARADIAAGQTALEARRHELRAAEEAVHRREKELAAAEQALAAAHKSAGRAHVAAGSFARAQRGRGRVFRRDAGGAARAGPARTLQAGDHRRARRVVGRGSPLYPGGGGDSRAASANDLLA